MGQLQRLVLALVIILVDAVTFFVPLGSLFLAYVIIMNPPWFRNFINGLDAPPPRA
jgi:hypothetical protein